MADYLAVLAALGGEGATLLKGEVTAVSTGRLTVLINGGEFGRVPYLKGDWSPVIGDQVYLLYQKGFGMLAIGSPVDPAADTPPPAPVTETVLPDTVGVWTGKTAAWTVPVTDPLLQEHAYARSSAWFFDAADLTAWLPRSLASVEIELEVISGTPQLALLRNEVLDGPPDTYNGPLTLSATPGGPVWYRLPLAWGRDLIDGVATGVAATSQSFDAVYELTGSLRLTSL